MYSLDINFLNDRPDLKPDKRAGKIVKTVSTNDRRPIYLGFGVLIFFPVLAAALWGVLSLRSGDLERQQADLDTQLGNLEAEKKNLSSIQAQTKQATEEAQALASVFNQLKPWSAMSQDIRDRLPTAVQLKSISQEAKAASSGATAASTQSVSGQIKIEGSANSFNDVNDFLLTLQQSNFLKPNETKLISAELGEERSLQLSDQGTKRETRITPPRLPKKVSFVLTTALSDVPASELIRELDRKGAVGLVTRIEALKQRGIISTAAPAKPATPTTGAKP